ncbi:hypothetical protein PI125_g15539 [Phytophthora idaei]|nr:hypothetical protein PI125_g15539 [Phytophthora idaei]
MTPEHDNFPHLPRIESEALHRLADVSGVLVVTLLLSSATAGQQRQAAHEFMERECQLPRILMERRRQDRHVYLLRDRSRTATLNR